LAHQSRMVASPKMMPTASMFCPQCEVDARADVFPPGRFAQVRAAAGRPHCAAVKERWRAGTRPTIRKLP